MGPSKFLIYGTLLCFLMVAFTLKRAWPHDPHTHLADGYSMAKSKKGDLCCDGKDYSYLNPHSWERTETGFRVRVEGKWVDIPADAEVGNMRNPDGEAKVWLYKDGETVRARCFMVGTES